MPDIIEVKKRKGKKPFHMYMPERLFHLLKDICEKQEITMTDYVMKSLITRMNMECKEKLKL